MKNTVRLLFMASYVLFTLGAYAADPAPSEEKAIQATTTQGDSVILHPNGRWEFVDHKKAAIAKEVASQYEENQGCPNGTQGGFLGFGRCIAKGDKDFNRGSIGGKGR
jgi:TolA-binding protein